MERCGIVAYKFFQNWLRLCYGVAGRYLSTQGRGHGYGLTECGGGKENFIQNFGKASRAKKFQGQNTSRLVDDGAERLAAPGSSAKPGPRSWSASKPDA